VTATLRKSVQPAASVVRFMDIRGQSLDQLLDSDVRK
jgi:hypothetical protein